MRRLALAVAVGVLALYGGTAAAAGPYEALYELGMCESGGDYTLNTGNGYFGKYQFSLATWQTVGGTGYPHEAPPEEQDARAWYLLTRYGSHHWPHCQYRLPVELRTP